MSYTLPGKGTVFDGNTSFAAGADNGQLPDLIDPNGYEEGDNVICRGSGVSTRFPINDMAITFENVDQFYNPDGSFGGATGGNGQAAFDWTNGLFQGSHYYSPTQGKEYLMASIGGRLYKITPGIGTASVFDVALDRRNRSTIPISYHLQADKFFIVRDGEGQPIIYDNAIARRALPNIEIPNGLMMGTGMGRIVSVGVDGGIEFGDIFDGMGNAGADMLGWTENQFLNEGFATALPAFMGFPTAVQFLPIQDTATGVGECLIWGENGCESFFLSIPRDQWKDSFFQRTALLGIGNFGHRNISLANQDIWFRSGEGWRTYRQARAQQGQWNQVPLSTNVAKWIDADTKSLLKYGSAITFNNRLIVTSTPYPNAGKLYHNGALSLDFDVLSNFGRSSQPAWDGHHTDRTLSSYTSPLAGLRILQFVKGKFDGMERAFMFALHASGRLLLKEVSLVAEGNEDDGDITARLRPRSYNFGTPYNLKKNPQGNFWISDVKQHTTFTVSYRRDQTPLFSPWGSFNLDVSQTMQGLAPIEIPGYSAREWDTGIPFPGDDPGSTRNLSQGYEFQPEIRFEGRATIRRFRVAAIDPIEQAKAQIQSNVVT